MILEYLEDVLDGLAPGDALPSERDLAQRFGVARMTVRQAMEHLVRTGQISRVQGSGTFRAERRFPHPLLPISFSDDMRARGLEPGSRMLRQLVQPAPARIARRLQLPDGATVTRIERLRLADGEPMAIEHAWIDERLAPGLEQHDLANRSLYEVLRSEYGLTIALAEQVVVATICSGDDARLLGVPDHAPALQLDRTSRDEHGRFVEHVRSIYRGDRYELRMTLPLLAQVDGRRDGAPRRDG